MRITSVDLVDQLRALETMVLCNNLEGPVDIALWEYAQAQPELDSQHIVNTSEKLSEELFSSESKFMSAYILRDDERIDYLKGAPDIIVGMCQLSNLEKNRLLKQVDQWAGEGLRLLGLAYRPHRSLDDHTRYIWAGLVAMEDQIRLGVVEAIQLAQRAGIKVKMITGDYSKTAEHIGRVLGLLAL